MTGVQMLQVSRDTAGIRCGCSSSERLLRLPGAPRPALNHPTAGPEH